MAGSSIKKRKADDTESAAKKLRTIADELDEQIATRQEDQEELAKMKRDLEKAQNEAKSAKQDKDFWSNQFENSNYLIGGLQDEITDLKEENTALKKQLAKYEKARKIMNSES